MNPMRELSRPLPKYKNENLVQVCKGSFDWSDLREMKNRERKIGKKIGEKVVWLEERSGGILVGVDTIFCPALIHTLKQMPKIQKKLKRVQNCKF